MFLLDTNVLSELMRSKPDLAAKKWMDGQESNDLFISTVTKAEIELGLALLPEGKRNYFNCLILVVFDVCICCSLRDASHVFCLNTTFRSGTN